MAQTRDLKYINREFDDFRSQLIEFAKNYFPDTYNDFSPTSPGMMFIEMASYVGDVLSFYQDSQLQETFLTHAKDPKNLFNLAYMMGYRPRVTGTSEAILKVEQIISASGGTFTPDFSQAAKINANATIVSSDSSQTSFFIPESIDFNFSSSYNPTEIVVETITAANEPETYKLTKNVKAISGKIKTEFFTIGTADKFKTVTLSDSNIVQVLSITDSDGNDYFEVPFLGIQFGSGISSDDDSVILPDATSIGNLSNQGSLNYNGSGSVTSAYDPTNFTYSKSYGIAPSNTVLTASYVQGGGISANVPANTLTSVVYSGTNLGSLTFNNETPAAGGRDGDTVEELRENALRAFNEQNRAVTLQDYTVRALSLPSKFGSIAKAYVTQDQLTNTKKNDSIVDNNPLALSLYVLAYDNNKKLTTGTRTLKENLKKYLAEFMLISDSINIKDAFVVNVEVNYEIIVRPSYSGRDVLLNCNIELQDYFEISKRNINQPINVSELFTLLDKVKGVQTVQKIEIKNLNGGNYSQYGYDVLGATKNNVVYPSYDPCIFEVKFPKKDIKGRVINL
jgi:hypothetical protein